MILDCRPDVYKRQEYGYTKQEFEGDELVDVQEESAPDEAIFSPDEVFEEE